MISSHSRKKTDRERAQKRLTDRAREWHMRQLKLETQNALTSWVDLAILECTHLTTFRASVPWIAKTLFISRETTEAAIARLTRIGLLKIHADGRWEDTSPYFTTSDGISSEAIRAFHHDILGLMNERLQSQSVAERVMKTAIFALGQSQIAEAQTILNDALSKIVNLASQSEPEKDDVLCFSAQLFSLSRTEGPSS